MNAKLTPPWIWTLGVGALTALAIAAFGGVGSAQTYRDSGGMIVPAIAPAGSCGHDFSANQPGLPNIGGNFGSTGPYANFVLIATVPANAARFQVDIENTSGAEIVIVRDDGTAASATAPVNASVFALAGGAGAGAQGGSWTSQTFKGRLEIYAASGSAQVGAFVD